MNRQELAQHLYGLADGTIEPQFRNHGICNELLYLGLERDLPRYLEKKARSLMKHWPKSSDDPMYPVPHPTLSPYGAYLFFNDLWADDKYGDNRRELCRFIADKLMEEQE